MSHELQNSSHAYYFTNFRAREGGEVLFLFIVSFIFKFLALLDKNCDPLNSYGKYSWYGFKLRI